MRAARTQRVYRGQKRASTTRMGNVRAVREAFLKAQKYARDWEEGRASSEHRLAEE